MKSKLSAFTLIELVVAATILVILTSIWFYSYTKNLSDGRDAKRKTDLSSLEANLSLYKKERGNYPLPGNAINLTNGASFVVAYQGKMNNLVTLSTANNIPVDPSLKIPYFYSTSVNRSEFQIAATLENSDSPISQLVWDYKSVSKNLLPTLILATNTTSNIDISSAANQNLFIFQNGIHTFPYNFNDGLAYSDGTILSTLITDAGNNFWQNSDYRSCSEIYEAAKSITPAGSSNEYQILNNSGALINTTCTCTASGCS